MTRNESGFTIIEVVLVLAIAGLIFLVVFLALPALQRSQRDSQRRSDLGRFMSQLETYASNNSGNYPSVAAAEDESATGFAANYLRNDGADFSDPQNDPDGDGSYEIDGDTGTAAPSLSDDADTIVYRLNAACGTSEGTFASGTGNRSVAAMIALENGIAYCQDNR